MFSLKVTGDLGKAFKIAADNASDLKEVLSQFSKYLRGKVKEHFEEGGPGWPALSSGTKNRLQHSFTGKFTAHGKLRKSAQKSILKQIEKGISKGKIPMAARSQFKAIVAGNLAGNNTALRAFGFIEGKKKAKDQNAAEKIQSKLNKLAAQTHSKRSEGLEKTRASGKHKLLGKLASSIKSKVTKDTLEVFSAVEWANVHDDGGTAGHGSKIPKREFMRLDENDLKVLATLLEGHIVKNT